MKVIATKPGYFGKLRAVGEEFDVPDGSKATWFEPVKGDKPADTKGGKSDGKLADKDLV